MEIMRLMRITHMGIPESEVYYCGIMRIIDNCGLMRLKETTGNSRESGRLRESHETQVDFWRLMRLKETTGYS